MSVYDLEDAVREMENILDMWEFMARPYTDEKVLKEFGTVSIDGDDVQITNTAMQSVVKLVTTAKEAIEESRNKDRKHALKVKVMQDSHKKTAGFASMSDVRISDELDKEIQYYKKHEGEECMSYGPIELMTYCRDRLRDRR